jgi:hypothetical protein
MTILLEWPTMRERLIFWKQAENNPPSSITSLEEVGVEGLSFFFRKMANVEAGELI